MTVDRVEIKLPNPPSANALFSTGVGRRFKSRAYEIWIEEAGWRLLRQHPGSIKGKYEIEVTIGRGETRRKSDLDNRMKALSDLLVSHRVIEDDSLAERVTLSWGPIGADTVVVVRAVG